MNTANLPDFSKNFARNLFDLALKCSDKTDFIEIEINYPGSGKLIASFHFQLELPGTTIIPFKSSERKPVEIDISEDCKKDIIELLKCCINNNSNGCHIEYVIHKIGRFKDLKFIADVKFKEVTSQPKILQFKKQLNSKR